MIEWLAQLYGVDHMAAALLVVCFAMVVIAVLTTAFAYRCKQKEDERRLQPLRSQFTSHS